MFDFADCQVARLQPICINGCLGQLPEDAGDILSVGYLQNGKKQGGAKAVAKALDPRRQRLAEFKLQGRTVKEQLDKFVADAHKRGDVYIIVLDQRFFCQQDDSQTGPRQWRRNHRRSEILWLKSWCFMARAIRLERAQHGRLGPLRSRH